VRLSSKLPNITEEPLFAMRSLLKYDFAFGIHKVARGHSGAVCPTAVAANAAIFRRQPASIRHRYRLSLLDICLKTLRYGGRLSARDLPTHGAALYTVLEGVLAFQKKEKLVEVVGAQGIGEQQYEYILSDKGYDKVGEALERNQYVGPRPCRCTNTSRPSKPRRCVASRSRLKPSIGPSPTSS
jgi:hypothetical protein